MIEAKLSGGILVRTFLFIAATCVTVAAQAQPLNAPVKAPQETAAEQLESDPYTRYELLDPSSGKFRILYEVTATGAGTTSFFNPIRKGSIASDERVTDLATGKPLQFRVIDGATARKNGSKDADLDGQYLQVMLARPVAASGGEGRILIDKTYEDRKSYFQSGDTIVFDRPLGINRDSVVLPAGYRLISCNFPAQVIEEADGRTKISFWNASPAQAPLILKARRIVTAPPNALSSDRIEERAHQSREIVYLLQQPETHRFDLYHDYTEERPGTATYVNVVRTGSTVSNPTGINLDTGAALAQRVVRGADVTRAAPDEKGLDPNAEAVVFSFPAVPPGGSARLRFAETYTDPGSYRVNGDEMMWERSLGRAANAVVLPAGWVLTNSSAPAITSELPDGRIRLDYINPRNDELKVLITARRMVVSERR